MEKDPRYHLEDAFTAVLSSDESWPRVATKTCHFHLIRITIPAEEFMTGVRAKQVAFAEEAYSKRPTLRWRAGDPRATCNICCTEMTVKPLGVKHWAKLALERWYSCVEKNCVTCGESNECWQGFCGKCWLALYTGGQPTMSASPP